MYSHKVIQASLQQLENRLGFPLREYSMVEVMDFAYRMKDLQWGSDGTSVVVAAQPEDIQEYILNELQRCKVDFVYWCKRYAKLIDDKGRQVTLEPWPSQLAVLKILADQEQEAWDYYQKNGNLPELQAKMALLILKARQLGGTAISEALLAHQAIFFSNTRAIIASDHPDNSLKLYRVLLNIVDSLPPWMKPVISDRVKANNLHFPILQSDIVTGAGNQRTTLGQGMTLDCIHLTEVSTWEPANAAAIDADMRPAFTSSRKHHSLFLIESTGAGGIGNWFHDQYQAARGGKGLFKSIFIGWFMCPDKYQMPADGITISDEVQGVINRINAENGLNCTKEQAAWYQFNRDDYKEKKALGVFLQEYPSFAEEAFQTGFRSSFPIEVRQRVRDKCKLAQEIFTYEEERQRFRRIDVGEFMRNGDPEKIFGKLLVWERAKPGYTYVVGVDASYGMDGGDNSSIQVIRVGNKWSPDEQVAEFTSNMSPANLGAPCWLVGHLYTDRHTGQPGLMAVESNPGSPGIVAQTDLQRRGYPNFYIYKRPLRRDGGGWSNEVGWWTTSITRPYMTEGGVEAIIKGELVINSPWLVQEMDYFGPTMTPSGLRKLEHAHGMHDDRLLALFIARYVAHESDTRSVADDRRRAYEQRFAPEEKMVQFQQLGITMDEAMSKWEETLADFS